MPDGRGREEFAPRRNPHCQLELFLKRRKRREQQGSGTDITSDRLYYPSSSGEGVNKLANEAADESRSHQQSTLQ